jgi:hypothetical protein
MVFVTDKKIVSTRWITDYNTVMVHVGTRASNLLCHVDMLPSRYQVSIVGQLTWIIQSLLEETLQLPTSLNVNFHLKNINLPCTGFFFKLLNWYVLREILGL